MRAGLAVSSEPGGEQLGQVHRAHVGQVGQLGAAREAVGEHHGVGAGGRGRRGPGRARRPRPTPRSGPSPCRSCRPGRSSRRPGSAVRPAPVSSAASVDQSSTEAWWQCGWATTSTPARTAASRTSDGEVLGQRHHAAPPAPPAARRRRGAAPPGRTAPAPPPAPRRPGAGAAARPARASDRRAASSWPVLTRVSPQHSSPWACTSTRCPAASSTRTAASATCGGEAVGEGVGPDHDVGRSRRPVAARRLSGRRASTGSERRVSTPDMRAASRGVPRSPRLASDGGTFASSWGSRPSV